MAAVWRLIEDAIDDGRIIVPREVYSPGSTGPRNSCCFSSSELILYQVSQMASHRRAETTPKGSYRAMPFRGEQRF